MKCCIDKPALFSYHEKLMLTARVLFTEFYREVDNLNFLICQEENYGPSKSLTLHFIIAKL